MRSKYPFILLLIAITLAVYWQVGNHEFVNFDDNGYVTQNPHVRTGLNLDNIRWAFTSTVLGNWHPLTMLSHMADCQLYGLDPRGHHLTNLFLHIANTVLLFIFLAETTGTLRRSAFAAALFALHPLHVESVAWIAERKDVLSTLFFMLTLLAYARYVKRPGFLRYLPVVLAFALGLMAKPMLVTLPFVLLLLDYWPLRRFQHPAGSADPLVNGAPLLRLLAEKLPLFILSVIICIVTFITQEAVIDIAGKSPFALRIANAVVAYPGYVGKMLWPAGLAVLYPFPAGVPAWKVAGAILMIAGVSLACWRLRRFPFLLVGWLWFLGTLVPVIGIVQVGPQAMADRYTYIPMIGLFLMVSWGIPRLMEGRRYGTAALSAAAAAVLAVLSVTSLLQTAHWKNSIELYTRAIRVTHDNFIAHVNLGNALDNKGRHGEAVFQFNEALRIKPDDAVAHADLANTFFVLRRLEEAVSHYREALRLDPGNARVHFGLGIALMEHKKVVEAAEHFAAAASIDPNYGDAHYNLGLALVERGQVEEAIRHYSEALRINPADAEIRTTLELALAQLNQGKKRERDLLQRGRQ
jgi:protein O-mannosyl-transferase